MAQDVFAKLPEEWFTQADEAQKWKGRFTCCNELFAIIETMQPGTQVKGGKKAEKAMGFLIQWLDVEQHVFTRMKILQILTILMPGIPSAVLTKKHSKLAAGLMKQWVEKKVCSMVTPVILELWLKCGALSQWGECVTNTRNTANPTVKAEFWAFIALCAEKHPIKAKEDYKKLLKEQDFIESVIKDCDDRSAELKKAALQTLCAISIFIAKDKDAKKYVKRIQTFMDENARIKQQFDPLKDAMKNAMKTNAGLIKKSEKKENDSSNNDDEKKSSATTKNSTLKKDDNNNNNNNQSQNNNNNNNSINNNNNNQSQNVIMVNAASSEELNALKDKSNELETKYNDLVNKFKDFELFMEDEKKTRNQRRLVVGTGASVHDLFENFLLNTIGMPQYLERFKKAGANDIRMIEHFDVPFLKDTIGVENKLEGKLLVKFIGKFNEETMIFRDWLKRQNVMKAYVNTFESKGIITWGILSDYCETMEDVQQAFRIKNKAHAHFLYTQLERYRNGELSENDENEESEEETDNE